MDLSAEAISYLRIIHMVPGLEHRRYPIPKAMITTLGKLTNGNPSSLSLTDAGRAFLRDKRLDVFGRLHNDQHELHLRDRLAELELPGVI